MEKLDYLLFNVLLRRYLTKRHIGMLETFVTVYAEMSAK